MSVYFTSKVGVIAALVASIAAGTASAQSVKPHQSVYTVKNVNQLYAGEAKAHSLAGLVSPAKQPQSSLMRNNTLKQDSVASRAGSVLGSDDDAKPVATNSIAPKADVKARPDAYGTSSPQSIAPYTTAGAYATSTSSSTSATAVAVTSAPWRATGKLYFNVKGQPYECTAAMIMPGLLVTAGHCVYDFGTNSAAGWHTDFVFAPAQTDSTRPYGSWTATTEIVPTPYYTGTDTCTQKGIVCNDDIAILTMAPQNGKLPGAVVGWYGYAWNGYSYVTSFGGASLASITQLGYPEALDSGLRMQRTDGIGSYWASGNLKNTVMGSAQTGGSSGGPWLVNFGTRPTVGSAANLGSSSNSNVIVGVTSWGYTTVGDNVQGASWFGVDTEFPASSYTDSKGVNRGAGNIGFLIKQACNAAPDHC